MPVDYAHSRQLTTADKLQLIGLLWQDIEDALKEAPNPSEILDEIDRGLSENSQESIDTTQQTKPSSAEAPTLRKPKLT